MLANSLACFLMWNMDVYAAASISMVSSVRNVELVMNNCSKKEASRENNYASGEKILKVFLFCILNIGMDFSKYQFCVEKWI